MKILEVKNNLVKISYTSNDNLMLGGFVIIEDSKVPYVAQIMSLKAESGINYAIVKLLFTFDSEGVVQNYNGTVPEMSSAITRLAPEELLEILPIDEPLTVGKIAQEKFILNVDFSVLEKNLLICSDKLENSNVIVSNLAKQVVTKGKKSIIFDIEGTINAENKLVLGKDFKLPLNYDTINFIYENDLKDVNPTSKAVIQDVFLEVQEYANTVLDKFIPFDSFISVVENQYKELRIPELALLKSRLIKYKEMGVFAQEASEIHALTNAVRGNLSSLIDLSHVDFDVQRLAISTIYDEIAESDLFIYSFVKITNENATKKLIRKIINKKKIYTTFIAPHCYKYLFELKERANNMILFTPQSLQHDFASYNIFLNKLNANECVIFGQETQNIPLILEVLPLAELQMLLNEQQKENGVEPEEMEDAFSQEEMMKADVPAVAEVKPEPTPEPEAETKTEAEGEAIPVVQEENPKLEDTEEQVTPEVSHNEETPGKEPPQEEAVEDNFVEVEEALLPQEDVADELTVTSADTEFDTSDDEIVETPDFIEEEVVEETALADEDYIEPSLEEEVIPEEEPIVEEFQEEVEEAEEVIDDDIISEEQHENVFAQEVGLPYEETVLADFDDTEIAQQNVEEGEEDYSEDENPYEDDEELPVYPVEDSPIEAQVPDFQPGDRVSHPKYGEGVVEKLTRYGNKVLCAVNFTQGRRMLDPAISRLTKI